MKNFTVLFLCFALCGCGEFNVKNLTNSCFENCQQGATSQNDKTLDLNSKISGGVHSGKSAISFDKASKKLKLSLPLTGASYLKSINKPLENLSNASLKFVQPEPSVTRIDLEIDLNNLLQNHNIPSTNTLPNGQPIPLFDDEAYGYYDVDVSGSLVRVYLSKGHLGIFVESPFDPYTSVSYPFVNKDDQVVGYMTQIPALAQHSGGFFSGLVLSEENLVRLTN